MLTRNISFHISDPGIPRNVTVNAEGTTLNISWLPPEYLNGKLKHYILYWKRSSERDYSKVNVTSTRHVLKNLSEYSMLSYHVYSEEGANAFWLLIKLGKAEQQNNKTGKHRNSNSFEHKAAKINQ